MNSPFNNLWQQFLIWLRVRIPADGLEVTDQVVRWCRISGSSFQNAAVKLAPGIVQDGKILDRPAFLAALVELRATAFGPKVKVSRVVPIVLSLGSAPTFMRLFTLPIAEPAKLAEAIALNLKMLSPADASGISAGSRIITEDHDHGTVHVAGLFIDRGLVDGAVDALREVGFVVVAAESKAVSLVRVFMKQQTGVDPAGAYIGIAIDDAGMDFMVIRAGVLCFSYAVPWNGLVDEQGNVLEEVWREALSRGVRQIMNFYRQHWSDVPAAVIVSAGDLFSQVESVVSANVPIPVVAFSADNGSAVNDVPAVFGAALRGLSSGQNDPDMTLLGGDATDIYREQTIIFFLRFWRTMVPLACGVVLAILLCGDLIWLARSEAAVSAAVPPVPTALSNQLSLLAASATSFNQSVNFVSAIEAGVQPKYAMIDRIESLAATSTVALTHIAMPADGATIVLNGSAATEDAILSFKDALVSAGVGKSVTLPLSAIQPATTGYTFQMTVNR